MTARAWEIVRRVRHRWKAVLLVSACVSLAQALVTAPLAALLLRAFLSHSGKASIGNFEIARFLTAPIGMLALLVMGTLALAATYLQVAALLRVLGDPPMSAGDALKSLTKGGHRILRLGALQVGTVLLLSIPLVFASGFLVKSVWGDRDLNGLLVLKPPEFWWGLAAGAVPVLLLVGVVAFGTLRWLFALPIVLEERDLRPIAALRKSSK